MGASRAHYEMSTLRDLADTFDAVRPTLWLDGPDPGSLP
jgi:hypothetical protein